MIEKMIDPLKARIIALKAKRGLEFISVTD
jgi:hypothetical protein